MGLSESDEAEEAMRQAAVQTRPECQHVATTGACLRAEMTAELQRAPATAESRDAEFQVQRAEEQQAYAVA
jgi:hypothetical protein